LNRYNLQRELSATKGKRTSKQLADLEDKRTSLLRLIRNWREVQLVYTPHVGSLLASALNGDEEPVQEPAEKLVLYLPSTLPPHIRNLPELVAISNSERRLREAQADDSLAHIRRLRRVIEGMWQFKKINLSGTGNRPNTRILGTYKSLTNKIDRYKNSYRTAYAALQVLDPNGAWSSRLKVLNDKDIRGPGKDPDDPTQNSRYEPSWIWLSCNASSESEVIEEDFNDSMRVEWAKAQARAARWSEELLIVQEEMRRVLVFLTWKSSWWIGEAHKRVPDDSGLCDGISAYAYKQSAIQTRMAERCAQHWLPVLAKHGITPSWKSQFCCATATSSPSPSGQMGDQDGDWPQNDVSDDNFTDREEENHSDLEDEEDIVASFTFADE